MTDESTQNDHVGGNASLAAHQYRQPRAPLSPRPWLTVLLSIAAGFSVLVSGVGIAMGLSALNTVNSPSAIVSEYLAALSNGHAEEAFALTGATFDPKQFPLMTDEVYEKVDDRISSYRVTKTAYGRSGDDAFEARVTATIVQAEESYEETFVLSEDGRNWGLFSRWTLEPIDYPTFPLTLSGPSTTVLTVEGIAVEGTDNTVYTHPLLQMPVLPGSYSVELGESNPLFRADTETVTVTGFDAQQTQPMSFELTEAGIAQAQLAVDAYIDGCVAQTVFAPVGCPYSVIEEEGVAYSNVFWTVIERPGTKIGGWDDGAQRGWKVTMTKGGNLTMLADYYEPSTGEEGWVSAEDVDFSFLGYITNISADGATFELENYGY